MKRLALLSGTAAVLAMPLVLLADQEGVLRSDSYRAERSVRLDPNGRYADALARLGQDRRLFGTIEDELALTRSRQILGKAVGPAVADEDHGAFDHALRPAGTPALEVEALADGLGLTFVARSPAEPEVLRLVQTATDLFVERRNAVAAEQLLEHHASATDGSAAPQDTTTLQTIDQLLAASTRLKTLPPGTLSFEDLADVDGTSDALQLLLEKAVLQAGLTTAQADEAERSDLETQMTALDQEVARELQRLAASLEARAARLRAEATPRPEPPAEPDAATLLETAGAYAVADAEVDIVAQTGLNPRPLLAIGLVSLLAAALITTLARWWAPGSVRHARAPTRRRNLHHDPSWPLIDVQKPGRRDRHGDRHAGRGFSPKPVTMTPKAV